MQTQILSVMTEYCAIYVDDINVSELAVTDPPLYARNMWQILRPALAKFNHPAEMTDYLFGTEEHPKLIEPQYDSILYTTSQTYTTNFTIELGEEYKGYDLAAARLKTADRVGNIVMQPMETTYDKDTGNLTVVLHDNEKVHSGSVLDIDLYKDGYFVNTITPSMCNIIGLCFQYVWQDRFNTDWLSMVSKVEDKSFQEQNRANKMNADGLRLREIATKLAGEMRKYEQDVHYKTTFPGGSGLLLK